MLIPYSKSNHPKQLFINNEYVDSKNSKKITLYNPKDGSLVASDVPIAGEQDVDLAVSCAEKAFLTWKKISPTERRSIMLKFADLLEEHATILGEIGRTTLGAPFGATAGEIGGAVAGSTNSPASLSRKMMVFSKL
jgi:aldehyde dehydrogenase (NAD+)